MICQSPVNGMSAILIRLCIPLTLILTVGLSLLLLTREKITTTILGIKEWCGCRFRHIFHVFSNYCNSPSSTLSYQQVNGNENCFPCSCDKEIFVHGISMFMWSHHIVISRVCSIWRSHLLSPLWPCCHGW